MKTRRINIYITEELKKAIIKKQQWYKVSLSTIVDKCTYAILKYIKYDEDQTNKIFNEYIYKRGTLKTSIKPKIFNEMKMKNESKVATNCLIAWINKDLKNLIPDEKHVSQCYSQIDNDLNKTIDPYYNYNEQIRAQRRMIKENKEYWKKVVND